MSLMSKQVTLSQAAELLRSVEECIILTHRYPDGDAIGSSCGLAILLQSMGKRAKVVCGDPFAARFSHSTDGVKPETVSPDAPVVTVDLADVQLAGAEYTALAERAFLAIDHHGTNTGYADYTFLDRDAAAACELVALLARELAVPLTRDLANCIYTGICTDTGCFKYPSTSARTHRIAAELIDAGADAAAISRIMFDTKTPARVMLEKAVMDSITYGYGGKLAVTLLSKAVIEESGAEEADINGLSAMARQIEGVELALFLRETGRERYKISARSGDLVDAAAFCAKFGGGGHRRAAGCKLEGDLDTVRQRLIEAAGEVL